MKHLLSGTALAAALVFVAPVWAQTSSTMTRSSTAPAASAAAPMAPMASERARPHRVRTHRTVRRGKARGAAPSDSVANQLNAQEAARTGGGAPSPMGAATGPYGQPNQIQGMPGAGQPSASSHMPEGPGPAYVPGQYQSSPSPNAPSRTR